MTDGRSDRWAAEAKFFDDWADREAAHLVPIDPATLERYRVLRRRRTLAPEFSVSLAGKLKDKQVLDLGCGDGTWSVLLARLGAYVTGLDVSPKAVELAKARADLNEVSDRCEFVCAPVETASLRRDEFDIVWGQAFLHHLLDDLDRVLSNVIQAARPGGRLIFVEPLNLNQSLRRLRLLIPVSMDATPDERPLERADLDVLQRHLPELEMRQFRLVGRLDRLMPGPGYEQASWFRRFALGTMAELDRLLLGIPVLRSMGSVVVVWGHRNTGASSS